MRMRSPGSFDSGMNRVEAREILKEELDEFAARPYDDLALLVGNPQVMEVATPSQMRYTIQFELFFEGDRKENLRIMGSIDDGGMRFRMMPLTETVIKKPDGSIIY